MSSALAPGRAFAAGCDLDTCLSSPGSPCQGESRRRARWAPPRARASACPAPGCSSRSLRQPRAGRRRRRGAGQPLPCLPGAAQRGRVGGARRCQSRRPLPAAQPLSPRSAAERRYRGAGAGAGQPPGPQPSPRVLHPHPAALPSPRVQLPACTASTSTLAVPSVLPWPCRAPNSLNLCSASFFGRDGQPCTLPGLGWGLQTLASRVVPAGKPCAIPAARWVSGGRAKLCQLLLAPDRWVFLKQKDAPGWAAGLRSAEVWDRGA